MPTVNQIDPIHTPKKFFLPRDTEEKDSENKVIYAYDLANEELKYAEGTSYRRKSEHGVQDCHVYDNCYKIFEDDILVAEAKVYPEIFDEKTKLWVREKAYKTTPQKITDITAKEPDKLESYYVDMLNTFGLSIKWQGGEDQSGKAAFELEVPGEIIRLAWLITVYAPDNLVIEWKDYKGNVESNVPEKDEEGNRTLEATTYEVIFEPEGVKDKLLVDPYLSVTEVAAYVTVTCDGYSLLIYYGSGQSRILSDGSVRYYAQEYVRSNGVTYSLRYDLTATGEIIEQTSTRIVIRIVGRYQDSSQNELDADGSVSYIYYIYPDRFIVDLTWITSKEIDIDSYTVHSVGWEDSELTNEINIAEISGVEKYHEEDGAGDPDLVNVFINDAEYIGTKSDEVSLIGIDLSHSDSDDFVQYLYLAGHSNFGWDNNATFPIGTHTMTVMWIIDSAERDGAAKIYDSADRLTMGDQYKDLEI